MILTTTRLREALESALDRDLPQARALDHHGRPDEATARAYRAPDRSNDRDPRPPRGPADQRVRLSGSAPRRPFSPGTPAHVLERELGIGREATLHGWRSIWRDAAADILGVERDIAELQCAHAISNATEAAYRRRDRARETAGRVGQVRGMVGRRGRGGRHPVHTRDGLSGAGTR